MRHVDLCVIGSGSGNSLIDERFADWSVALVDDGAWFGGTCLNVGCIPTKMFVHPAELAASAARAARLGVDLRFERADWPAIRDRIFGRIDPIAESGERWREESENVTLYRQTARFVAPMTVEVGDERLVADRFVIAAGSRPIVPDWPGMADEAVRARVHTSDTIMRIDALPQRLVILGGGAIAAEFAHVFASFGTAVTMVNRSPGLLTHHDETISARFTELLSRRVAVHGNQTVTDIEPSGDALSVLAADARGIEYAYDADLVLVARGRTPNSDRLDLEAAGVAVDRAGYVIVDEHQRTSVPGIYALGDVCNPLQLKHVANHEARVVAHNLLHPHDLTSSDHRFVPQAVFSDPEVASVGATEQALRADGVPYVSSIQAYGDVAYGWAMEDADHLAKVLADPTTGLLLGAHIVGPHAAILLQPLVQAMTFSLPALRMARGQYWPHPALSEVVENALLGLGLES